MWVDSVKMQSRSVKMRVKILSRQREKAESTGPFQSRRVNVRSRQGKQARIKVFQNFIPNTCILCGVNKIFWGKKEVYSTGQMKLAEKDTTNQHFWGTHIREKHDFKSCRFTAPKHEISSVLEKWRTNSVQRAFKTQKIHKKKGDLKFILRKIKKL